MFHCKGSHFRATPLRYSPQLPSGVCAAAPVPPQAHLPPDPPHAKPQRPADPCAHRQASAVRRGHAPATAAAHSARRTSKQDTSPCPCLHHPRPSLASRVALPPLAPCPLASLWRLGESRDPDRGPHNIRRKQAKPSLSALDRPPIPLPSRHLHRPLGVWQTYLTRGRKSVHQFHLGYEQHKGCRTKSSGLGRKQQDPQSPETTYQITRAGRATPQLTAAWRTARQDPGAPHGRPRPSRAMMIQGP